jgi:pimeloyl-ACP methyl ester carboxylesterase
MKGQCDNQKWGFTNEYLVLFRNHQFAFIPDAGHFISVEQPESYIKAIKEFISKKIYFKIKE